MIDPFDIWTEARLPREIKCQMDAESAGLRHRVNEVMEDHSRAGEAEVVPLGKKFGRDRRMKTTQRSGEIPGAEAGGVDHEIGFKLRGFNSAGPELNGATGYDPGEDGDMKGDCGAGPLGVGLIGLHQGMTVDDSSGR